MLRRYVRDESVDLIYLDPPFNSRQDYNVLFAEKDGTRSSSQITAFEDTWEWNLDAERAYQEVVEQAGWVSNAMQAFRKFLGNSDMMAYLAMMAPRLLELKRVLKVTGSIYLHCDPTASHYLKMLMDAIFGPESFAMRLSGNELVPHNDSRRFARITTPCFFIRGPLSFTWTAVAPTLGRNMLTLTTIVWTDGRGYRLQRSLTPPGLVPRRSVLRIQRVQAVTRLAGDNREKMEVLDAPGRMKWSQSGDAVQVRYLDEMRVCGNADSLGGHSSN